MRAPLVPITLAFVAGILAGTIVPGPSLLVVGGGLASIAAAIRWRRRPRAALGALLMVWLCLGMLRIAVWRAHPETRLRAVLPDEPQAVRLHGVVVTEPVRSLDPDVPETSTALVRLLHARREGRWQPMTGRVRATIHRPRERLRYGDEVLVEGQWSQVPAPGNPGQYDWRAALARKRVDGFLRIAPYDAFVRLPRGQGNPVLASVFKLRHRWQQLINRYFEPKPAGLLGALLLGDRRGLGEDLKQVLREVGVFHLLVISGFHVGVIALLLEMGFRVLGLPWRLRLFCSAIGLGGYCVLTGLAPPVARATLMAWMVLGAFALDRVISWPNVLAAAALILLWIAPAQLFDPGFQLSFGAVLSLLVFAPRWQAWLDPRLGWMRPSWLRRYVAISVSATGAIWVGLSPILANYFHLVSPIALLANLLIAPLVSALVFAGTATLLVGTFVEPAVRWGSGALMFLSEAILRCVSWCHAIPGGAWMVASPGPFWLAGYYGLVGTWILRLRLGWSRGRLLVAGTAAITVWVWGVAILHTLESRWLRVDVLDVGHGDSIVVRLPRGNVLLIDAGDQEAGRFRVLPFLRASGITSVDALVLTHPDGDHLGGAIPLLKELSVRRLLTSGAHDDRIAAREVRRLIEEKAIPEMVLTAGMTLHADPGVRIEVLHPPKGFVPRSPPSSNDNSLVLKLTRGSVSLLLTGDIEEAGLPWLLQTAEDLEALVLKVPHHGSRLGRSGERLFRAVRPTLAILSVGRAHGLPAPETVRALEAGGAMVYSTRRDGAIRLRTDGVRLEVRPFKGSRDWHPLEVPGTF